MIIHNETNASRSRICQPYARSATERNLRAKASSRNARTTFTELSQPPERGNDCSIEGKMANTAKGMARAKANPNIPIAGPMATPIEAACTSNVPIIGPVQENETKANVKAMKKILNNPLVESALLSSLVVQDAGSVSSKAPKKEMANTTKRAKNRILNTALVAKLFNALAPKMAVISNPRPT